MLAWCTRRAAWCWGAAALSVSVWLAGCATPPPREDFATWSERFAADWVRLAPEFSTSLRYFPPEEQAALDAQVSPPLAVARERRRALAQAGLERVRQYLAQPLPGAARTDALTLKWSLERTLAAVAFEHHQFAFAQTFGQQTRYVSLFAENQPLRRAADVPALMVRLAAMGPRIEEQVEQERREARRGYLPPRFILRQVRTQLAQLAESPLEQEPVLVALRRRIMALPDLAPDARERTLAEATRLVEQRIRPAWRSALALVDELLPLGTEDAGLWRHADGAAAYAQALASHTTTAMTADEIHALGLAEVARIEATMDALLRQLGRAQGSVNERMAALNRELQPPAEPDPRPQLLLRYAEHIRDAERRAAPLFNLKPRAAVEVRRVPPLTERNAAAHYTTPAPDGSRPGVFWVPLPGPQFGILTMRSLAVHEAVPGHHFQLALQQETPSLPRWRQLRIFGGGSAHSEGWALYAERLAIEQGWYEGDVHGLLGAWSQQLFRARRLVVDTGLHAKRWTREQAIAYGISASEVERYVVNPGQACAYMVGMLRILALREEARAAMGAKADDLAWLRDFHDVVLKTGSVPLDVLAEVVREWSRRQRG